MGRQQVGLLARRQQHPVVVVANLEKSELFGVESDGMLLAAGEEADLLTTHEDAVPGTRVR